MWGQNIMISILDIQPNSEVPLHSHPHEQFGFILEGEIETTLGDETKIIKKGDAYHALSSVPHGGKTHSEKVTILDVFSPPREDYMK
jgi:quercetin dioxygenase-like cupin family protein